MRRNWLIRFFFISLLFNSACNHLFYFPRREVLFPPENLKLKYENIQFTSSDGTKLSGWLLPSSQKNTLGTIVQFHGNAENMTSHYLGLVWLTNFGYDVFTFDYRGYGSSEGEPTQKGTVYDGVAALKTALQHHKKGVFVVWGQSLGGAILQASLERFSESRRINLVILDSTFSSYRQIAASVLRRSWVTWLFSPLAYVLISDRYANLDFPKKNQLPVLVIHDEFDNTVPFSNGEDLFNRIKAPKNFWRAQLGGHLRMFAADQEQRRQDLVQFLASLTH